MKTELNEVLTWLCALVLQGAAFALLAWFEGSALARGLS